MKILALSMSLLLSVFSSFAFSEEVKTIDIKEMARMAHAIKQNESLMNDPKAMAAMKQLFENLNKSPELQALIKNPEGLAAMMRLAGSIKISQEIRVE